MRRVLPTVLLLFLAGCGSTDGSGASAAGGANTGSEDSSGSSVPIFSDVMTVKALGTSVSNCTVTGEKGRSLGKLSLIRQCLVTRRF